MKLVVELSNNSKSIIVTTNELASTFSWEKAYFDLTDFSRIELQTNNQGIIIYLKSGMEYLFDITYISKINNIETILEDEFSSITDNETLFEELAKLINYKT
jgi:hypothetical protein